MKGHKPSAAMIYEGVFDTPRLVETSPLHTSFKPVADSNLEVSVRGHDAYGDPLNKKDVISTMAIACNVAELVARTGLKDHENIYAIALATYKLMLEEHGDVNDPPFEDLPVVIRILQRG